MIVSPVTDRAGLERFVRLPPSPLELREKLEQLRALEAGMRIDVALVDTVPLGVDTPEDLERARELLASSKLGPSKKSRSLNRSTRPSAPAAMRMPSRKPSRKKTR